MVEPSTQGVTAVTLDSTLPRLSLRPVDSPGVIKDLLGSRAIPARGPPPPGRGSSTRLWKEVAV